MSTSGEKGLPQNRTYTVDDIAAILGIGRTSAFPESLLKIGWRWRNQTN